MRWRGVASGQPATYDMGDNWITVVPATLRGIHTWNCPDVFVCKYVSGTCDMAEVIVGRCTSNVGVAAAGSTPIVVHPPDQLAPGRVTEPRKNTVPLLIRYAGEPAPARAEFIGNVRQPVSLAVSSRFHHSHDPDLFVFTHTPLASTVK